MDNTQFLLDAFLESRQMVAKLNTKTAKIMLIYHEDPEVPLNTPIDSAVYFLDYISKMGVLERDRASFDILLHMDVLRALCKERRNGTLFSFCRMVSGRLVWSKMILRIPGAYSEENPDVLLLARDLSQLETDLEDVSHSIDSRMEKILKYNPVSGSCQILKQSADEKPVRRRTDSQKMLVEEEYVHPEDLAVFRTETDPDHVIAHFLAGNTELTAYYRRRCSEKYHWVKLSIRASQEYTPEHPVFLYFIIDVHRTMVSMFAPQIRNTLISRYMEDSREMESYYENMPAVISFFTRKYLDFYLVDLVNDRCIKYKSTRSVLEGNLPYVGTFSEVALQHIHEVLAPEDMPKVQNYASVDTLRTLLSDKATFDFSFTLKDGKRAKTTCIKAESTNGIPTKIICKTVLLQSERALKVKTFGSFEVYDGQGKPIAFKKKKSKQLLAYLVDKYGFPVSTADLVTEVLEKPEDDLNAKKYVSTLFRAAQKDLAAAGYPDVLIKEWNSLRVDIQKLDCDYYHLMDGDTSYWEDYHNEYMKEYSWAEETNAELLQYGV